MNWVELLKIHSITHISVSYCELMWIQFTSFRRVHKEVKFWTSIFFIEKIEFFKIVHVCTEIEDFCFEIEEWESGLRYTRLSFEVFSNILIILVSFRFFFWLIIFFMWIRFFSIEIILFCLKCFFFCTTFFIFLILFFLCCLIIVSIKTRSYANWYFFWSSFLTFFLRVSFVIFASNNNLMKSWIKIDVTIIEFIDFLIRLSFNL